MRWITCAGCAGLARHIIDELLAPAIAGLLLICRKDTGARRNSGLDNESGLPGMRALN